MSFGGGSPGMSILMGVARAVESDDRRRREIEQEAINRRLKEAQIRQADENLELQREREQRYRDQEIARQEEVERARTQAEVERAKEEEHRQVLKGLMAEQFQRELGMTPEDADIRAELEISGLTYRTKEPEEVASFAERKWRHEQNVEADLELDMSRIIQNDSLRLAVTRASNPVEAQAVIDDYNAQHGSNYDASAGNAVWLRAHQSAVDPGLDYADWDSLPSDVKRDMSQEAATLAGHSLAEAEEAIARWRAGNPSKESIAAFGSKDAFDIAQSIILNKINGFHGGEDRDIAVMNRMLLELERLRQAEMGEGSDDRLLNYTPLNAPKGR